MKLFLVIALLIFGAAPAFAQDMLREHREGDPTAQLFGKDAKDLTLNDYSGMYYDSCVKSNTDASMAEYVAGQCGCTAAKMTEFMTVKDMKTLFTKTKEGDYQQGRVLLLAYIPCMYDSVYQFVYDGCYFNQKTRNMLRHDKKVCECYAHAMGDYVASKGQNLVPGFRVDGFYSKDSVPNPLTYIIKGKFFSFNSGPAFEKCVMVEERGWGK